MKTIIKMFDECVVKFANNTFMWEKTTDKFTPTTYKETKELIYKLSSGLHELGVSKNDKVALLSEGRNEWILSELAILHLGAVNVPLSIKLDEKNDLLFRIVHSDAKYVIVSKTHLEKIRSIASELSEVKKIIVIDDIKEIKENEIRYSDLMKIGSEHIDKNRSIIDDISSKVRGNDLANISYTSGTTADPKGIMLSHRNYTANVEQAMSLMSIEEDDSNLLILPLDHCFAHVAGFYSFMAFGANVATVERGDTPAKSLRNIPISIKEIKPSVLMSVPALAKSLKKSIDSNIKAKGGLTEKIYNRALKVAFAHNREGHNKKKSPLAKLELALYDKILFSKIRENAFGGRLKFFIGGGALLDIELQRYFYALGTPMLQGYGLSEATPIISANSMDRHKLGSSGYLVKNLDIRICDPDGNDLPLTEKGEIVVKGENVMLGYWKNEEATKNTIKDGWLFTGDMGYMDNDGFLYVLGRFKSLLIAGDGEKYAPEGIEEALVGKNDFIDQVVLHNNQSPYTVALVVPNIPNLKSRVEKEGINWSSDEGKEYAIRLLQSCIDKFKTGGELAGEFPERWLPATFSILPEPFTEHNRMINSTMKVVRNKVEEAYKDRIDYMYTPEGKNIKNSRNIETISLY